jgi:4a-hydroxytetrahydrobiopterin dehydratase
MVKQDPAMATNLADQKCVPCRGGTPPLTREQIAPLLVQLEGWQVEDDKKLIKSFKVKDFVSAVDFVNRITPVAEAEGHHPDLYVRWGEVRVYLWTHKIDGLTESDFYMAAKIDRVFAPAAAA